MSIGQRIESSRAGQAIISLGMVVVIVSVLLWNLPAGRPRTEVGHTVDPVVRALALEQDWQVFAPDPRAFSVGVYATVTYRDGRTKRIGLPHNGVFLSPYRNYRWQKYVEKLRADASAGLWEPTARWFARQAGGRVVRVVLTRTFQDILDPGTPGRVPPVQRFDFYSLDLP